MLLRRSLPVVAALAAAACAKGVTVEAPPSSLGYAMFDVSAATPVIPLPNDLGLQQSSIEKFPASAFRDMLQSFADSGGYPNDQEVAVTIPFTKVNIDAATGATSQEAPDLDLASVTSSTLVILKGATPATYAPILPGDYVKDTGTGVGTLTLHNLRVAKPTATPPVTELKGAPWDAGATYIVAVRGGANGVKFTGGQLVNPQFTFALLNGGKALNDPANQSIIPGTAAEKAAAGAQLEALRAMYATPFAAVDGQFPHTELAVLSTFKIAPLPAGPQVVTDTGARGIVPLPIDLMLAGPASKTDGTLNQNLHVQSLASLGALAPGIASLDGFSTTAMVLASVSGPILADTVNATSVFLYDMTDLASPVRVKELSEGGSFVAEPCNIAAQVSLTTGTTVASGCAAPVAGAAKVSTAIGLQPAIPVQTSTAAYFLPPLKERTTYGVIITKKVKGLAAVPTPLSRSTLSNILLFPPEHKVASDDGKSLVSGIPDSSAALIEGMRRLLHPLIAQAITDTKIVSRDDVAIAYTFRTQSVTGKYALADAAAPKGLIHFAALPYQAEGAAVAAGGSLYNPKIADADDASIGVYTPAEAWEKWGLDAATPNGDIGEVIQASTTTQNLLDPATGAFNPTGTTVTEKLKILLVTPQIANMATCPVGAGSPLKCGKLIVWHHGLGGRNSKASVLAVANAYAKQGYFVVAYDGAKHGDRSWCSVTPSAAQNAAQCGGGTCDAIAGAGGQGDTYPPGLCHAGVYTKVPTACSTAACMQAWVGWGLTHSDNPPDGKVAIAGNYVVSANFFRVRDTLRQDVIDASGVILALSRPPAPGFPAIPGATNGMSDLTLHLVGNGMLINGFAAAGGGVHWLGHSFGAMQGTLSLAANPRLTQGVLIAGGGTLTDIFTNSPAYAPDIAALLAGLTPPILPGTADYLKFINVAKWILDPAEPLNAAGHILGGSAKATLPDLLFSNAGAPQAAKTVLFQLASCDSTVPNAFNLNLSSNIGSGGIGAAGALSGSTNSTFVSGAPTASCPMGAQVSHSFITGRGIAVTTYGTPAASFSDFAATVDPIENVLADKASATAADYLKLGTIPSAFITPAP